MILARGVFEGPGNMLVLLRGMLDGITDQIALLDSDGTIIAVNEAWKQFGDENGATDALAGVGTNYRTACQLPAKDGDVHAQAALDALQDLMQGVARDATVVYPCHAPKVKRWFRANFRRLEHLGQPLFLVTHSEITGAHDANSWTQAHQPDILELARVSAVASGQVRPQLEAFDLSKLIATAVEKRVEEFERLGTSLELRIRGPLIAMASPFHLQWMMQGLLMFSAARKPKRLRISAVVHMGRAMVELTDNAETPGEDWLQMLAEARADEPQDEASNWLRTCRALVEAQGGNLYVAGRDTGGMACGFSLPTTAPEA